jgi:hypothetical protein
MAFRTWFKRVFKGVEEVEVRARDEDGRFLGDDKSTPDVDEAYTTVDVPIENKKNPVKGRVYGD